MHRSLPGLATALLCIAPSFAVAEDDPGAAKHAVVVAAMAKQACVPPATVVVSKKEGLANYYAAFIGSDGPGLAACVARAQNGEITSAAKPFQCWSIDAATYALTPRPATFLPGRTYRVPSACAEGFCKPKEKTNPDAAEELLGFSTDGTKVARITESTIQIYDAKTKTFQREFPMYDEKTGEGNGLGAGDVIYAGDMLIVVGFAAGPDAGAWMWNAGKGKYLGPVGTKGGYVNLYGGSYLLADATHFVAFDGGYEEATVDLTTGAITMKTLPLPAACSADDLQAQQSIDVVGDGDKVKPKCTKAIRAAQKKFWPKPAATRGFLTVGGKGYRMQHGKKAELLVLEPGAAKPKAVPLPLCAVK